ncbi:glycoside hydrolase [Rickenella mellea]|uniref:Glycoside hydrolase n=1 Tax=Rickenella mellea TaxID=50990 RepID=A0A4Y7PXM6_9AGAM|nr:glycoside hydrolase [Rickenella mellea]
MFSPSLSLLLLPFLALVLRLCNPVTAIGDLHINRRTLITRTPAAPHFVVYSDAWNPGLTGLPSVSDLKGFNVLSLSFLLISGPSDNALAWATLTHDERTTLKAQYKAAGIRVVVSAFGSTDQPTTHKADPIKTARSMASWVHQYHLDGIDVDYEDFDAFYAGNGKAEAWVIAFTEQLRVELPQPTYILTHAPVAPLFSPHKFGGGAYLTIDRNVGSMIDWYNIQFYNQGANEYTTCNSLLTKSSNTWSNSSVFQIASTAGIPMNKLVIGKPGRSVDASDGYMDPAVLASCLHTAKSKGWIAGVSAWQFPHASASWIRTVRSLSFPE